MALTVKRVRMFGVLLPVITFAGCGNAMSARQTEFDWSATESAPAGYAMRIIHGNLHYRGSPSGVGLYVPNNVTISHGWGRGRSNHVTGPALKPLPDKLDITFFSYLEDQLYEGSFDLPYEEILKFFNEQDAKPKILNADGKGIPILFKIVVGVAPGGTVAVWAIADGSKEVFFGKAKKVDGVLKNSVGRAITDRAERAKYAKETVEDEVPAELRAALRKNGIPFDRWANYRIRYQWVPTFIGKPSSEVAVGFFNGEGLGYSLPLEKTFATSPHPVPDSLGFRYVAAGQNDQYRYDITLNESETIDAFKKLSAKQLPMQLEIDPRLPKSDTRIRLHNGKDSIDLKKFTVK